MLITRVHGRPIVAYSSVEEAKRAKSCLTCSKYQESVPCRVYAVCRAGKASSDPPFMYSLASEEVIDSRLTTLPA